MRTRMPSTSCAFLNIVPGDTGPRAQVDAHRDVDARQTLVATRVGAERSADPLHTEVFAGTKLDVAALPRVTLRMSRETLPAGDYIIILALLQSYLIGRMKRVNVNGVRASGSTDYMGVPHGSLEQINTVLDGIPIVCHLALFQFFLSFWELLMHSPEIFNVPYVKHDHKAKRYTLAILSENRFRIIANTFLFCYLQAERDIQIAAKILRLIKNYVRNLMKESGAAVIATIGFTIQWD
ncbi:hypothetical protein EVAR_31421_1 [Eumeta japonica]|uniref:Uncharacterized protein n=1 Tax=Eumeta variegata TaxID=151549 RepID=A0A4C1UZ46_EUMVA|nr:hypothetical protein EVAR_31421_1 [Eumeta japonica]